MGSIALPSHLQGFRRPWALAGMRAGCFPAPAYSSKEDMFTITLSQRAHAELSAKHTAGSYKEEELLPEGGLGARGSSLVLPSKTKKRGKGLGSP